MRPADPIWHLPQSCNSESVLSSSDLWKSLDAQSPTPPSLEMPNWFLYLKNKSIYTYIFEYIFIFICISILLYCLYIFIFMYAHVINSNKRIVKAWCFDIRIRNYNVISFISLYEFEIPIVFQKLYQFHILKLRTKLYIYD